MATRTRRDVWQVPEWDESLVWYARAIREMQRRPLSNPRSWRYQGAIHEFNGNPNTPGIPADARRFWNQCQHGTWFFLPWHRWYLLYFEEVVASTIVELGGPEGWALPYWNYSDTSNEDALSLAPEFTARQMPDGTPNPLRVEQRRRGNDGRPVGDARHADLSCLREPQYQEEASGGSPGFGGPVTVFEHGGDVNGRVEDVPHGSMHVRVGGFMGAFSTAGLDPLFWLHHANIDRLWEVWRRRNPQHVDPVDPNWLETIRFDFHDGTGAAVSRTVADVVDIEALGYTYEDLSDPFGEGGLEGLEAVGGFTLADQRIPEMVGATETPVELGGRPATTRVEMSAPTGPGLEGLEGVEAAATPSRVFVNIENVTGEGEPRTYSVYVNDVYAGILPMFGVPEATQRTDRHSGGGREFRLEVTHIVQQLQAAGNWDPSNLKVTFVPDDEDEQLESLEGVDASPQSHFQVGRVSVYLA